MIVLACCFGAQDVAQCSVVTLTPNGILQFDFTSPGECPLGACDTLLVEIEPADPVPQELLLTGTLFNDAGVLLGTDSDAECCLIAFVSASSKEASGTVIDFAPLEGSFTGYVDLTVNTPVEVNLPSAFTDVSLFHANANGVVLTESIALIPEPGYAWFIAAVLLACAAFGKAAGFRGRGPSVRAGQAVNQNRQHNGRQHHVGAVMLQREACQGKRYASYRCQDQ